MEYGIGGKARSFALSADSRDAGMEFYAAPFHNFTGHSVCFTQLLAEERLFFLGIFFLH